MHHLAKRNALKAPSRGVPSSRRGRRRRWRSRSPPAASSHRARRHRRTPAVQRRRRSTPVKLQLQWFTQAQFAGYYAAVDQGYYKDEGLDVADPRGRRRHRAADGARRRATPTTRSRGCPRRSASREQGAGDHRRRRRSSSAPAPCRSRSRTRTSPTAADLKGKKVGNWGFGNEFELFAGMTKAGLDPAQGRHAGAAAVRHAGAAQGRHRRGAGDDLQRVRAGARGGEPRHRQAVPARATSTSSTGTTRASAMLQDAIWANTDKLERHGVPGHRRSKFIKASIKGWVYCRDNAEKCRDLVVAEGLEARRQPPALADQRDQQADLAGTRTASA